MEIKLLCTLGPSSMNDRVVARLEELGVDLFRLNLSHVSLSQLPEMIDYLQKRTSVPICLDTEGAQIRTGNFVDGQVVLAENSTLRVPRFPVPGDSTRFNLYPANIIAEMRIGDYLTIDSSVLVQVADREGDALVMRVLTGGSVGRNKATTLDRDLAMPPLTDKDVAALRIGRDCGIGNVALSFAHRAEDVDEIRRHSAPGAFTISKIECLAGLANLKEIASRSDALLIDRGDLSRQVPIERIPMAQKRIIEAGRAAGRPVYVATNLMESMMDEPSPTRAEVNDVFNTLLDGATGLVLAGETAVGGYPIECASMVRRIIRVFEETTEGDSLTTPVSLLREPHGGHLVQCFAQPADLEGLERLRFLNLPVRDLLRCEQIAVGTYSPLSGFMNSETLRRVLDAHELPDGTPWPAPIVLPAPEQDANRISAGERIALRDEGGEVRALLDVAEVFGFDFARAAPAWFGSDPSRDPEAPRLMSGGVKFLAGEVLLVNRLPAPLGHQEPTPAELRFVLGKKSWNRVISFHTHSLPHRVHEYLQHHALALTHADGLYVSVETGAVSAGDYSPEIVLRAYQGLLDFRIFSSRETLIGGSAAFFRNGGPRKAVAHALCRKNYGFSHVLFGHADTTTGREIRALFDAIGDIGIEPVFFDTLGYDPNRDDYVPLDEPGAVPIDGERMREAIESGERLNEWFIRSVVQDLIQAETTAGNSVFVG